MVSALDRTAIASEHTLPQPRTRRDRDPDRRMTPGRIRLLPDALLSVPVFGLSFLWVALVQVGEWAAFGDSPGNLAVRLTLAFAVQVLMFAFPFVTLRTICPRVRPRNWTWLLLVSIVVGATARGIALGALFVLTGVTDSPEFVFRIVASISHLAVITVLLWFLVSEVRGSHSLRRQLIAEREQLLDLQLIAQRDLVQLGDRAAEEIRHSVLASLGGLQGQGSVEFRDRLRVTIDDVVRPLSHRLAAAPSAWPSPQAPAPSMGVDWPLAVRQGLDPARIHPVVVPVVLVWLGLPIHLFQFGPTLTAGLVATLIVTIPTFWLARTVAIRLTTGRGTRAKAAGFVIAVLIGGLALGLATLPYMQGQPQPFVFVVAAPLLNLLVCGPLAIAEAARDQDAQLEVDLKTTTADLRWTLARARERYRQQEGALARTLHSRLQASLAAAFLRLDRAVAQGADDDILMDSLRADVLRSVAELDAGNTDPEPIDTVVVLTQSNWLGAAQVDFSCDPRAREALERDPLCARSVNELIPELVFNSVKHGNATSIEINLEVADHRTLSLSVIDNGTNDLIATRYGLGSAILDEASIAWTRGRSGSCTATTCLLPYLKDDEATVTP